MTQTAVKRFSQEEYHRLAEMGFFQEDDRIELIHGEIVKMVAKGTAHVFCCRNLIRELSVLIDDRAILQCQDPIALPNNSEPEPDFTIVRLREDNYLSHHPYPEDIIVVIEIADSSLEYDRTVKLPLYAEAGIPQYWIFNLPESQLEMYSQPYQKVQGSFDYSHRQILLPNSSVTLPELGDRTLDLSEIFPKTSPT
ncbi:MAG: Uma2 family endonuclease [Geitlerinemataceae cyanobacterium]